VTLQSSGNSSTNFCCFFVSTADHPHYGRLRVPTFDSYFLSRSEI
jgi:hypothetical protein